MKLLLTSTSITNEELRDSLVKLAGKTLAAIKIGFVITAANPESGDKHGWLEYSKLYVYGLCWIDIICSRRTAWIGKTDLMRLT